MLLTETRIGRGRVHFTAPLRLDGSVNTTAYGARWGSNWAAPAPGVLRMPPGRFVGNARALVLQPQITKANVPDYTALGDGGDSAVVEGVRGSVTLYGTGARNLVDALCAGALIAVAGGSAVEVIPSGQANLESGSMLFTQHAIDTTAAVSVTPSWTTWTEGVHWAREAFGVLVLQGYSAPAGATVSVAYRTEGGSHEIEALGRAGVEAGLVYAGVNTVNGRAERTDAYRCVFQPAEALELINEGATEITLGFELKPVRPAWSTRSHWFRTLKGEMADG